MVDHAGDDIRSAVCGAPYGLAERAIQNEKVSDQIGDDHAINDEADEGFADWGHDMEGQPDRNNSDARLSDQSFQKKPIDY
jgi:hypothetical protein